MLTDPNLRSQVDALWDKLWSGGLSNPLDAIEQFSYLLFLKRFDEEESKRERAARHRGVPYQSRYTDPELRWSAWTRRTGNEVVAFVRERVFPFMKSLGAADSSYAGQMEGAEFKIDKATLLLEATKLIDAMRIGEQNQDVQGDLYEYLLNKLSTAGRNGQFRTPRHIIRMMVEMVDPQPMERICDPAAGTGGFLVNAFQYILERHTSPGPLMYDQDGTPHNFIGDLLTGDEYDALHTTGLTGFDNDSGRTMLRIASMNLMLHGIERPNIRYADTLSKGFTQSRAYDLILANPPFKGAIDAADVNPDLPARVKKTEVLFLHLFLRLLEMGGRCAAIVPEGILFNSQSAHVEIRRKLIEENRLEAVVCMPSGVFRPYAGVTTAVLLFARGGTTDRIWFYDMEHDGFSLDDKRQPAPAQNDIPDVLTCWAHRHDAAFAAARADRLVALRAELEPLKAERLRHHEAVNRLTFEQAVARADDLSAHRRLTDEERTLAELEMRIHPLQVQVNQLTRQFWVTKEQVVARRYDLSANRYHHVERDEAFHESPVVTIDRLQALDRVVSTAIRELRTLIDADAQAR